MKYNMLRRILHLMLAVIFVTGTAGARKAQPVVEGREGFDRDLTRMMDSLNVVGLSVAVVRDNDILFTGQYGVMDLETKKPIEENTLFRIASISKSFTVTTLMQLYEQGLVDITADVSRYLPFTLRNPRYPDVPITIEMMMSHTSSINDSQGYYTSFDPINPDVSGDDVIKCYNDYAPGTGYEYCNYNTNLLACVIESVTGRRWYEYVQEHILKPLGLEGGYNVDDLDSSRFATLYAWDGKEYIAQPEAYQRPDALDHYELCVSSPRMSAAGGMKISAADLARYMLMHMNYGKSPLASQRIISPESSRRMQTVISDRAPYGSEDRDHAGLGLMHSDEFTPGIELVGHTGGAYGLRSAMFFDPDKKYGFVMICNGTTTRDVIKETLSLMHKHFIASQHKPQQPQHTFEVGKGTFLLDGEPFVIKAAEVHYPRIPREYWEHRIEMCKALGMNALCLYVFWNVHEPRPDEFDFTGNNDIAEFCRLAQKHGMWVIVRPGPYVCAEWEMGGLPWWLLKKDDIRLREQDPYFMERVRIFEHEVGRRMAPLTIDNDGPIIMVQVENEYGSYGVDKPYVSAIRDIVRESGFDGVPLFQCDWSSNFTENGLDDLIWTMNFGTGANIDEQFAGLKQLRPDAPLMCSEFWSGWFDKWGANHETRAADDMVAGIDEMLSKDISFSLYMTHGGTSFGHWAGANSPGFAPDVTSYDYDAPITEWGTVTPKYHLLRQTLAKYSDKRLPPIPKAKPVIEIPRFALTEHAPLQAGVKATVERRNVTPMEPLDMGYGVITYSTVLPEIASPSLLTITEPHDYVLVYINDKSVGTIDRSRHETQLQLEPVKAGDRLTLVVEAMGRINFGRAIKDYKGITEAVSIDAQCGGHDVSYNLKNWTISLIPDDYGTDIAYKPTEGASCGPGYYRGHFNVSKPGDTFLDFSTWGKGQVWVNGHPLGRIWSIGPQQTLYMPGCWLKKGENEIVVLDVAGPAAAECSGLKQPVLDCLNVVKSNLHNDPARCPDISNTPVAATGSLTAGNGWQTLRFDRPCKGKYLVIDILSNQDGEDVTAIAELYVLGADGQRLSRESWQARYADSENERDGNHTLDKVFDMQESTYWTTVPGARLPHRIAIRMGDNPEQITGIEYLPRAEQGAPGSAKAIKVYVR